MGKKTTAEDSLRTIIPKIAKGIQEGKIKLKSMGITNAEDLRLRKLRKIYNIDDKSDLLFVVMYVLQIVVHKYLFKYLRDSEFLISYATVEDLQNDMENVVLPSIVSDATTAYLFCLNLSCAFNNSNIFVYYESLFNSKLVRAMQTEDGRLEAKIYEDVFV